jgi:hypothetical protein
MLHAPLAFRAQPIRTNARPADLPSSFCLTSTTARACVVSTAERSFAVLSCDLLSGQWLATPRASRARTQSRVTPAASASLRCLSFAHPAVLSALMSLVRAQRGTVCCHFSCQSCALGSITAQDCLTCLPSQVPPAAPGGPCNRDCHATCATCTGCIHAVLQLPHGRHPQGWCMW